MHTVDCLMGWLFCYIMYQSFQIKKKMLGVTLRITFILESPYGYGHCGISRVATVYRICFVDTISDLLPSMQKTLSHQHLCVCSIIRN